MKNILIAVIVLVVIAGLIVGSMQLKKYLDKQAEEERQQKIQEFKDANWNACYAELETAAIAKAAENEFSSYSGSIPDEMVEACLTTKMIAAGLIKPVATN